MKNNEIKKPKKEDYGWHKQDSFDDLPSGWMMEGGEEAHHEALRKYELSKKNNQTGNPMPD